MSMSWSTQRDLIRDHVGPKFEAAGITTRIVILDHNWDLTSYVENIYADEVARDYIAGSAWHCYGGEPSAPGSIREQYPEKEIHFTECSGGEWDTNFGSSFGWNLQNLFIGQTLVGSRTVMLWNYALDENHGPREGVTGGCTDCRGVITVPSTGGFEENVEYYAIGHFAKFLPVGSTRIGATTYPDDMEVVAFETPGNELVVIILNTSWDDSKAFEVIIDGLYYHYENLPPRSAATLIG